MTWKDDSVFSGKKPAVDVTVLSTGDARNVAVNVMPAKAEALLDIRLFPNQEPLQVVKELNQLLDKLMKENPELRVELEVTHCQKVPEQLSDFITEDDPLVQEILEFSREYTGRQDIKMEWAGGVGGGRPDLWNAGSLYGYHLDYRINVMLYFIRMALPLVRGSGGTGFPKSVLMPSL